MKHLFICIIASLLFTLSVETVSAQKYIVPKDKRKKAFAEVVDDPKLPRVLIIGDSISIGYTPALRDILMGKANVHRIPTNGGPTTRGLDQIDAWLGDGNWDVIHFNWGLHDLKYVDDQLKPSNPKEGHYQVDPNAYDQNLRKLVARLKKTGAKLIWRNTTPVPEGTGMRVAGDAVKYNAVAAKIMEEHEIPTDDQFSFVMKHMSEVQRPANVHFTEEGSRRLAELAANAILQELSESN